MTAYVFRRAFAALLLGLLLLACDDDPERCTPGVSVACVGAGACKGGQVCAADGDGYGECLCGALDDGGNDASTPMAGSSSQPTGGKGGRQDGGPTAPNDGGDDAGPTPDSGMDSGMDAGADAGDAGDAAGPDPDFGSFDCNPLTNVPCTEDERCALSEPAGETSLSCLPDGTSSANEACEHDTDGSDDCRAGLVCIDNVCKVVCDLTDYDSCSAGDDCVEYAGLYDDGSGSLAGACTLACDPVTQLTSEDAACGGPGTQGCYLTQRPTHSSASCVSVPTASATRTQGAVLSGTIFSNSCAPGYAPIIKNGDGDPICSALCTPVESWNGSSANIGGMAPHTCAARGADTGFECRFLSVFALHDPFDPLLNTIGICVEPAELLYDSNDDTTPDTAWPSCATLANTDTDGDLIPDHQYWGCAPITP